VIWSVVIKRLKVEGSEKWWVKWSDMKRGDKTSKSGGKWKMVSEVEWSDLKRGDKTSKSGGKWKMMSEVKWKMVSEVKIFGEMCVLSCTHS
jgi:hypothetical protein